VTLNQLEEAKEILLRAMPRALEVVQESLFSDDKSIRDRAARCLIRIAKEQAEEIDRLETVLDVTETRCRRAEETE